MLATALDTILDRTVVLGYSRIGIAVRRRLPWWDPRLPAMHGRTAVVTGATGGIGLATAEGFARLGADVVIVARDAARGAVAAAAVTAAVPGASARVELGDLASLASVRELAARLAQGRVDVLVHNAGVLTDRRRESVEGVELTLATNVLGPFLLTRMLEEELVRSAPSRVIWVSSGGMYTQRLRVGDLQAEAMAGDWDGPAVYARSKRAQVVLAEQFAGQLAGTGVVVHAMHPGWVATPGLAGSLPGFSNVMRPLLRTAEQGADTVLWLGAAAEPGLRTGGFWHDRRRRPTHLLRRTRETADERVALWAALTRLE